MGKLILYSPVISNRLKYAAGQLIEGIMGMELLLTGNPDEARSASVPVINYSADEIDGSVKIMPSGLLEEEGIRRQSFEILKKGGIPFFFKTSDNTDIHFDIISSTFYMLSRYEEYLPFRADRHGRFPFSESMACRYSLAGEPLVELWACCLRDNIERLYPRITFPANQFTFIPTIDVDIPWAYKNRGILRTAGGVAREILNARFSELLLRLKVIAGNAADPYDTFSLIGQIHAGYGLDPLFFFSAGTYGRYDKCISPGNSGYKNLVRDISGKYSWGIHPSYLSADDPGLLRREVASLHQLTGSKPVRSRQHYLRLRFPDLYRKLVEAGIYEDYTLGWPEMPGFRAGTCTPFRFYDIEMEESTSLMIYPFQIMDGSLLDYMGLDPDKAVLAACRIADRVKDVGGTLITLWHNESFSDRGRWENWTGVYHEIVKCALS